jgi:hypothetical protein
MAPTNLAVAGILTLTCTVASAGEKADVPPPRTYAVQSVTENAIIVDGVLGDSEWPAGGWEMAFSFPWQRRKAPRTGMCCASDGERLLFAFQCDDADIVLRGAVPRDESLVARGDRVELFFAQDGSLDNYYCLEMSPAGTVLDYRASFYRKFDDSWDCPGLVVAARTHAGGYAVEGSIPLTTLRNLCETSSSPQQVILVGAFRGEFSHSGTGKPKEEWISWIRPKAEKPDFHIPSAFGRFRLKH